MEGNKKTVKVITDHKNLEYFQTAKLSNRRQARWSMELQRLDFKIYFRPGKQGGKPHALIRRPGEEPIKSEGFIIPRNRIGTKVQQAKTQDYYEEIRQAIKTGRHQQIEISECRQDQDKIFYKGRQLIAPDLGEFTEIILRHHDHVTAGHPGRAKTLEKIKESYVWEGMRKDIDRYVDNCEICQRTKPRRDKTFGLLNPLPVPSGVWKSISIDYITGLPETQGYDAILVVVDRLSKMAHYIPTVKEINTQETAKLLLHHVWKYHGTSKEIISDRGPQFDSQVWKQLCKDLRIEQKMSTAYHPQTDGQTERTNQSLEHYLRAYVDYMQNNWLELLPFAEFVYNRTTNESTKRTPFQAVYGQNQDIEIPTTELRDGIPRDMQEIEDHLKSKMARAQDIQSEQANTSRTP